MWNELSFSELTAIAKYATTDPNIPTFLKHAAEELYAIRIRYDAKKKRYRICKRVFRKKRLTLNSKLLTLLSLHDLLYSLSWLLNAERTQVECRRTKAPIATLCGKYFAPAENLTDLTLGEFLLAEDLLAAEAPNGASRKLEVGSREVESADTSNFQLQTSNFKKSLPSDLLYALCDGDFTKLETIRNTNLWDAMRLLQTTAAERAMHR